MDYLKPGFDPRDVKVADLRRILTENGVSFPSRARKVKLIRLFETEVKPRIPGLRRKVGIKFNADNDNEGNVIESSGDVSAMEQDQVRVVESSPSSNRSVTAKRTRDILEAEDRLVEMKQSEIPHGLPDVMEVDEDTPAKLTTSTVSSTIGSPSPSKKRKRKRRGGRGKSLEKNEEEIQSGERTESAQDLPGQLPPALEFTENQGKVNGTETKTSTSILDEKLHEKCEGVDRPSDSKVCGDESKYDNETNGPRSNITDTVIKPCFTIKVEQKKEIDQSVPVTHSESISRDGGGQEVTSNENVNQLSQYNGNTTVDKSTNGDQSNFEASEQFVSAVEYSMYDREEQIFKIGTKILSPNSNDEKSLEVGPGQISLIPNAMEREDRTEETNLQRPEGNQVEDMISEVTFTSFPNDKLFDIWNDDKVPLAQPPTTVPTTATTNVSEVKHVPSVEKVESSTQFGEPSKNEDNDSDLDALVVDTDFEIRQDDIAWPEQDNGPRVSLGEFIMHVGHSLAKALCLLAAILLFILTIIYIPEGFRVGYCGHELPIRILPHNKILSDGFVDMLNNYLEIFKPSCIPCPDNALCYSNLVAECMPGFNLRNSTFSLGGLLPVGSYCVKDTSEEELANKVFTFVLKQLRYQNSFCNCGTSKSDLTSGFTEGTLYALAQEDAENWFGGSAIEFDRAWDTVQERLKSLPEIKYTERGSGTDIIGIYRSTSLEYLSLKCRFGPHIRALYVKHRVFLYSLFTSCLLLAYVRTAVLKHLQEKQTIKKYKARAIEELKRARTKDDDFQFLHNLQLRDIVLFDVVDPAQKILLWEEITKMLENDTTNISCTQSEYYGEILTCWKWIGELLDGRAKTAKE